jgi:5-methylcytosine-specific restriction protein A
MISTTKQLIQDYLSEQTGASISVESERIGPRTGLSIWFEDLGKSHSPVLTLTPKGLTRHSIVVSLGRFARQTQLQMASAPCDALILARALLSTVKQYGELVFDPEQDIDTWSVKEENFRILVTVHNIDGQLQDAALIQTCTNVVIPIIAALAELIGYVELKDDSATDQAINGNDDEGGYEGATRKATIKRRERNRRSRLLCIQIHGEKCFICGVDPRKSYGAAGGILQVHHLEPLSLLTEPKRYDPRNDLIPLCPNCHFAVHTKRPFPLTPEELIALMAKK